MVRRVNRCNHFTPNKQHATVELISRKPLSAMRDYKWPTMGARDYILVYRPETGSVLAVTANRSYLGSSGSSLLREVRKILEVHDVLRE